MALYKGAKQKHLSKNYTHKVTDKNCVILHTSASASVESLYGWFSNPNAYASSHFHVATDGTVEQYIDTKYVSWANGSGNSRSVTIETQGDGSKGWSSKQVVALVKLIRWICSVHDIPVRMMTSSATSQHGIGWHRLGVNGNFPKSGLLAGRIQRGGGQVWSKARGKVCPGDDRIEQIPGIVNAVKNGDAELNKPSKPRPKPSKPSTSPDQSRNHTPDGSTNFPENYADLTVNGNWKSWEVGALQILMNNIFDGEGKNQRWDGDFGKLTVTDFMRLLQRNGYYLETQWDHAGVRKGTPLVLDGKPGYWFWVEVQRMLGNDEKNRSNGKVFYDLNKFKLDGQPEEETYKGLQRWLNAAN